MKKILDQLMILCPGRLQVEINKHLLFNETASEVLSRGEIKGPVETMAALNKIIRIDAVPVTKDMPPIVVHHYDVELALLETLNQIKKWKPKK